MKTTLIGIFWWMYVAAEKFILEHTKQFVLSSSTVPFLNNLGVLFHFTLIIFISGFFTMIRFRGHLTEIKPVLRFSFIICAIATFLDTTVGSSILYGGKLTQLSDWYVWCGYLLCIASCLLFAQSIFSTRKNPTERARILTDV